MKDHFNNLAVSALRGLGVIFMTAGMFLGLESIQQDFTAAVNAHRCTSGFSVGMPPCADPAPAPLPEPNLRYDALGCAALGGSLSVAAEIKNRKNKKNQPAA
jgi:hypothetical protein